MRRIAAALVSFFAMSIPVHAHAQKAGVGAWENSQYTMLDWIERTPQLGWYYNWRTDQMYTEGPARRTVEFVPMIHGSDEINKRIRLDANVKVLLGFNEPDGAAGDHQANLSVDEAVRLWPMLERHGLRLGSPATTQDQTLGSNSWQRKFMTAVETKGLRVDFMAVHYYSKNGDVRHFRNWLHSVYAEYRRPIWVTEFAYIDWSRPNRASYQKNARFMLEAITMMENLPFVERHAWFAANPYSWGNSTPRIHLVHDNLNPTPLGEAFHETLNRFGDRQLSEMVE